jgi:putative nucleotidyltransferase with HDIG domain
MHFPSSALAAAGALAASTLLLEHERTDRQSAERFAAAALEALLNAIDANDADTGAHVRRVATYSLILAEAADISESDRRLIEQVALFHDIGKIHEALFDIIHVDRKLTPAERREMLTHPERGAEVLRPLNGFYPELCDGVLAHHERWNGRGYPRGLKGRHIPLSARVVAIADTFDAITHHRRYSDGRTSEMAREIILAGRETEFDPELVDLFVLPPVFTEILNAQNIVSRWKKPVKQRRSHREVEDAPDITFRWRPGRSAGPVQPQWGPPKRKAR